MMAKTAPKPVVLCILDGWGCRDEASHNAIKLANTPNIDFFEANYPMSKLGTSGEDVGLPVGQMGNSEVGHMSIGGGRIIYQNLPRINKAIVDGTLKTNPYLVTMVNDLKQSGGACHLMGLVSDGGVHSHIDHIIALAKIISHEGVQVYIHAFMDGRDTPPSSAADYMGIISRKAASHEGVDVATVSGRYYAMDRDNRWDRVELAYNAMVHGDAPKVNDPMQAIEQSYADDIQDEFILPVVVGNYTGMKAGDSILMANFRSDRARQLLDALVEKDFDGFDRKGEIAFSNPTGMVEYSDKLNEYLAVLFPKEEVKNGLGQIMADQGLSQLRIAETEKYAHVTFFFNGGVEAVYPKEERILIPSPKVATYDQKPEMAAFEITAALEEVIADEKFDLIVVNYANTDMVGHTGSLDAAMKAVETVDECLGRVHKAIAAKGGVLCITADHGNAEMMVDPNTNDPHTAHTTNPVPWMMIGDEVAGITKDTQLADGRLSDIAPTILGLMGLEIPSEITGNNLIKG